MMRLAWVLLLGVAACGEVVANQPDAMIVQPLAAPTGVTAAANIDLGARLSWTAPAGDVTSYTVTATPAGGTVKVVGTAAIITGLTSGQAYTFTVSATNAGVTGPASDPSNSITIVAGPAAPPGLRVCGANTSAVVRGAPIAGATFNLYHDVTPGVSRLSMKETNVTFPFKHTGLVNGQKRHYVLTVVDASGVESAESPEDSATPDSAIRDTVFVASFSASYNGIEIIDCVSKAGVTGVAPVRTIRGAATMIAQNNYNNVAVDAVGARLFHRNPGAILVWDNATTINGDVAPTRTFSSGVLTGGRGLAYDPMRDLLYVSQSSDIHVFANASTATGAVAPARTINVAAGSVGALVVDVANDRLYADNQGPILVYNTASAATGAVAPARTISISGATITSFGVALDATNNTLYISSRNENRIYAVANASTVNGAVAATRTITPSISLQPMGIAIGGSKLVHLQDSATAVQVWNDPNTLNGTAAPTQNLQFPTLTQGSGLAYVP